MVVVLRGMAVEETSPTYKPFRPSSERAVKRVANQKERHPAVLGSDSPRYWSRSGNVSFSGNLLAGIVFDFTLLGRPGTSQDVKEQLSLERNLRVRGTESAEM
jgi:hypothetical protein